MLSLFNKVVIIDDKLDEVQLLINYLNKKGVANFYFDGKIDSLPEEELCGIRIVFLDIALASMQGQSNKTIISSVVNYLNKVIANNNGPLIIAFWSKHTDLIPDVVTRCKENGLPLSGWLELEKVISKKEDIEGLEAIIDKFITKRLGFYTVIKWEHSLQNSGKEYIYDFSCLADPDDEEWSNNIIDILVKIGQGYRDNNLDNKEENTKSFELSDVVINRGFGDILEQNSSKEFSDLAQFFDNSKYAKSKFLISEELVSKLNTILFLSKDTQKNPLRTGNVYLTNRTNLLESSLIIALENKIDDIKEVKLYLEKGRVNEDIKFCYCLITPECDLAHPKNKALIEKTTYFSDTKENVDILYYRTVYGFLFKNEPRRKKFKRISQRLFPINNIWFEDAVWDLAFDFSYISVISIEKIIEENFIFRLKTDLLFDLQSQASNHVNRLGNFLLDHD